MFTVEYVDSVDPLIGLVQTDPGAIFEKPHVAYLLFLFGEADRETADWIRNNLKTLDSLLGPDIAGAVFVKRFEVRALVRSYYTPRHQAQKIRNGEIDLREIRRVESGAEAVPMFDARRDPSVEARRSMEDLTATTYASDDIARSLGLVGDLPCIAFLDALPGPIRCLPLDGEALPNSLTSIRRIVGRLITTPGYEMSRAVLGVAHAAGVEIGRLLQAREDSEREQRQLLRNLKNPLIAELRAAHASLVNGSARQFRHQLRRGSLPQEIIAAALVRASKHASSLTHVGRTIRGVSWYAAAQWPLSDADHDRLAAVLASHVADILGVEAPDINDLDERILQNRLAALEAMKARIIADIWGDLPSVEVLEREFAEAIVRATKDPCSERERLADQARRVSAELEECVIALREAPRITEAFDAVIGRSREATSDEVGVAPDIMERLLSALTSGAVKIVGRDIYIGTNVAAMGPFASAEGTTFS